MKRVLTATVLAAMLATEPALARAGTSIADVVDHPEGYAGARLTVTGTVTGQPLGYGGESVYTLSANERRIDVFSRHAPPVTGERLEVDADVGFRPPDEEFTFPPILLERARRPAP